MDNSVVIPVYECRSALEESHERLQERLKA